MSIRANRAGNKHPSFCLRHFPIPKQPHNLLLNALHYFAVAITSKAGHLLHDSTLKLV